jgi:hypothetical protein
MRNNSEVVLMKRKALHSAVMEVGLYFQKGWSVDHIAWFTHRLQRRRQRARDEAARARRAARALAAQGLGLPFQIELHPDRAIAYAVAPATTGPRTANERLFDRLRARLSRRLSGSEARNHLGLPCVTCGRPAVGWNYVAHDEDGQRVIDGYATCAEHRSEESVETLAGTQTG